MYTGPLLWVTQVRLGIGLLRCLPLRARCFCAASPPAVWIRDCQCDLSRHDVFAVALAVDDANAVSHAVDDCDAQLFRDALVLSDAQPDADADSLADPVPQRNADAVSYVHDQQDGIAYANSVADAVKDADADGDDQWNAVSHSLHNADPFAHTVVNEDALADGIVRRAEPDAQPGPYAERVGNALALGLGLLVAHALPVG